MNNIPETRAEDISCLSGDGIIEGKFDCGYLVSVKLGSEVFRGVLYHPDQLVPPPSIPKHEGVIVPFNCKSHRSGRRRRNKRRWDPNYPKPNRSGYNFFFAEKHYSLKSLYPNREREFTKMIGQSWNSLSPEERMVYQNIGLRDKERYKRELTEYKEKMKWWLVSVVDSESKRIYMGDTESCGSGILNSGWNRCSKQRQKVGVYNEVLCRLKELNATEAVVPGFEDDLWTHFYRLPTRYALDMNVERAQDILMHKRLLDMARTATGPAVEVRLVQIRSTAASRSSKSFYSHLQSKVCPQDSCIPGKRHDSSIVPRPSARQLMWNFLLVIANYKPMHEITISTNDKPKLLCQLTSLLSEIGLDIQEAHAFSTIDGYSLDVFVVGGWVIEEIRKQPQLKENGRLLTAKQEQTRMNFIWRIDAGSLRYEKLISSGPFSDLFKGTFCNQDVAIKVLKHDKLDDNIQKEFAQEVYILSKIQHKNVVKFVGACTKPPNLYLVTEYMSGGSMFDFCHKQKTVLDLPSLLKVAIDVSEGMKYLHQNDIIHRDLKAANLLIDENGVVKVADFGVARMHNQSGIMTAETGTYRWMAPELPYKHLSPLQAAIGVMQKGLRPKIPRHTHPKLVELLHMCWHQDPSSRPNFSEILEFLLHVTKTAPLNMVRG
ncbi:hypothetical protein Fmac_000204 [Flemingia macrophylla]|uniref:Uncharacterized protein n=1 Tax=Flemingia macrophylla TaxID=520843 RepID=A0ABD1NDL4_9FABA